MIITDDNIKNKCVLYDASEIFDERMDSIRHHTSRSREG